MASPNGPTHRRELESFSDLIQTLRKSLVTLAALTPDPTTSSVDEAAPVFDFVDSIIMVIKCKARDDPLARAALEVANTAIDFSNAYTLPNGQMRTEGADEDLLDRVDDLVGVVQRLRLSLDPDSDDEELQEWLEELRPEANAYLVALADLLRIEGLTWLEVDWRGSADDSSEPLSTSDEEEQIEDSVSPAQHTAAPQT